MWDWLGLQAQNASPFIASFCLACLGVAGAVIRVLWNQLLFERSEHRKSEVLVAELSKENAVSNVELSQSVDQLTSTLNGVLPALMHIATRGEK